MNKAKKFAVTLKILFYQHYEPHRELVQSDVIRSDW